jgi:hypothetical protein
VRLAGLLVLALVVGVAACSDSSLAPLPTDLSRSFNLQSIQISSVTEPNSNGTLQLGTTSYDLALTINGQIQPEDVGTYTIGNPNTWVQTSTTKSNPEKQNAAEILAQQQLGLGDRL